MGGWGWDEQGTGSSKEKKRRRRRQNGKCGDGEVLFSEVVVKEEVAEGMRRVENCVERCGDEEKSKTRSKGGQNVELCVSGMAHACAWVMRVTH